MYIGKNELEIIEKSVLRTDLRSLLNKCSHTYLQNVHTTCVIFVSTLIVVITH